MRALVAILLVSTACGSTSPTPAPPPDPPPPTTACGTPAPSPTHECVQDCGPPVSRPEDPPPAWTWLSAEEAARRREYGCPRCLPEDARIATPTGDRRVSELAMGDPIWTRDVAGRRVAATVVYAASTPIVGGHTMVEVHLDDGRTVMASAPHPDASGQPLDQLVIGAAWDGASVARISRVPYRGARTYDVLPSGPTGVYWANEIELSSSFVSRLDR